MNVLAGCVRAASTPETIAFARRAAARTMVLLKNEGDILPLPRNLRVRGNTTPG